MNQIEKDLVYTIKIANGDEIVTKVVDIDADGNYIIAKPLTVVPTQTGIQMMVSLFTANPDQSVTINTNSIAMYVETDDNVRAKYTQATTGIQVPDKKIIMG